MVVMMISHMLSTSDNPFNPFTQFDEWNAWDLRAGYNTLALQARVCVFPYEASDADQDLAIEYALQDIMAELGEIPNADGDPLYILVRESTEEKTPA
jgi:hypothetical protein